MSEPSASTPLPSLITVDDLYNQSRFIDIYDLTRELWDQPGLLEQMSTEELVMAGRVAHRLGGSKLARWLLREAHAREPESPRVRYYATHAFSIRPNLYETLADFDADPHLQTDDTWLQASWLAYQSLFWLSVRDFPRAYQLLDEAHALEGERAWVDACKAQVLLADDRWEEALEMAERAWAAAPGMPGGAVALGRALARVGRFEEAANRLTEAAMSGQSYEVAQIACWYALTLAERTFPDSHASWCEQALRLIERVEELAPLADSEVRKMMALAKLDVAVVTGDRELLEELPDAAKLPFVGKTLERLRENPDRELFVLPISPIYQKHNTCLPASLGAALGGLGEAIDVDALARELTFGGTPSYDAAAWLEERGCVVRHFIATEELVRQVLKAGLPFVFGMEWDTSAHATTALGLDDASNSLIVHDPSRERWVRLRLEALDDEEAPLGPKAMAVVPADQAERLDLIPTAASEPLHAFFDYVRTLEKESVDAAAPHYERLRELYPEHPLTQYVAAIHEASTDQLNEAINRLQAMLQAQPRCLSVRRLLVGYLHRVGNTARVREVLGDLVQQKLLMGTQVGESWKYPPSTYICQYADLLALSADHVDEAIGILHDVVRRDPGEAEAYHILADVLCRDRRFEESVLLFRVAASLAIQNGHYAGAFADILRQTGREDEGLQWLRERAERYAGRERGAITWTTLVEALQQYGQSERAAAILQEVMDDHPEHDELLAFAIRFYVRQGEWRRVWICLEKLKAVASRAAWLELKSYCEDMSGDWRAAMSSCQAWLDERADNVQAQSVYQLFVARDQGRQAALTRARELQERYPGHDEYEYMVFDWLRRLYRDEEVLGLLRERLARNPHDAWAWRELAHRLMDEVDYQAISADDPRREGVLEAVAGCQRTCPEHEVTRLLLGRIHEADGDREAAIASYFRALETEPEYEVAYRQIWEASATLSAERQKEIQHQLEACLLKTVGQLHGACHLALLIAARHGREAGLDAVRRWRDARPADPELIEAEADVLLEVGEGRSDAGRAVELLKPAIRTFPAHRDLRLSLARAYMVLVEEEREVGVWRDFLKRYPTHNASRLRLAGLLEQMDPQNTETPELLQAAVDTDPLDESARDRLARYFWQQGDIARARATLEEALVMMPEAIRLRETLIGCCFDVGDAERAVAVAREATEHFPDGSYCWLMYAQALRSSPLHSNPGEVERALRQALNHNIGLYEAADELAALLTELRRYDEAREALRPHAKLQRDPAPVLGRLAWVDRQAGKREEATTAMAEILGQAPWYIWGWRQLMEWLKEDEDSERVKALLQEPPPPLLDEPELRADRLDLLEMAGTRASKLVPDWDQLLNDFPQDRGLYLRRFDRLWNDERQDEARRVLEKAERFHPRDPYLLARKAIACATDQGTDELREVVRTVWTLPGDEDVWPEETALHVLVDAAGAEIAIADAVQLLRQGERLRLTVMRDLVHLIAQEDPSTFGAALELESRKAGARTAALHKLLEFLEAATWEISRHRALVIKGFLYAGHAQDGIAWCNRHEELVQQDTALWEAAGRLLVEISEAQARDFLATWHQRQGVSMYTVTNYVLALRAKADAHGDREALEAMRWNAHEGLTELTLDHTARYLACAIPEASLRLQDEPNFLASMEAWRSLIADDEDPDRWYMGEHAFLPEMLMAWETLTLADDPEHIQAALAVLGDWCGKPAVPAWARGLTLRLAGRHRGPLALLVSRTSWAIKRVAASLSRERGADA